MNESNIDKALDIAEALARSSVRVIELVRKARLGADVTADDLRAEQDRTREILAEMDRRLAEG